MKTITHVSIQKQLKHVSLLLVFPLLCISYTFAQIPSGYYSSASNLTGNNLKAALHTIIKGHTTYPYSSSNTDVWDILKVADRDPLDSTKVIGIYSGFSMDAAAEYNGGRGWNREHVWAKSRGNFGTRKGAGTDLHHMRAADVSTNSARNNRNFDYATTYYIDQSGNYSGATLSKTSTTAWVWEPRDEVKGDIARMIFYMATRYEGGNGEPDLELTETLLSNSDQSSLHAKLSILLAWHQSDPVSAAEIKRNDIIYGYQNNRNPFIDHPEYVCLIYGCSSPGGSVSNELFISEYIEGSSYNKAIEIANYTGATVDLSQYSLKKQTNGSGGWTNLSLSGNLDDGEVYVISHASASSAITNEADITPSSSTLSFNGNDPIALFKGSTLIDIVGTHNGGSGNFAKDVTLVRKSSVTGPNSSYTVSEWSIEAKNDFSFIGSHTYGSSSTRSALVSVKEELNTKKELSVYPNPAQHELNYSIDETIVSVHVVDIQGRMQNISIDSYAQKLDISQLNKGVYVLIVQTEQGTKTMRFVKQ